MSSVQESLVFGITQESLRSKLSQVGAEMHYLARQAEYNRTFSKGEAADLRCIADTLFEVAKSLRWYSQDST